MVEGMWSTGGLEALVLGICGIVLIVRLWGRRERVPPGPWAWPVIGHLHLVSKLPHQALRDMSKTYGPIMGLRLGQQRAVVVTSPELAKQVLVTNDKVCASRPPFQFASTLFYANDIAFGAYGPIWRKLRRICIQELFTAKRLHELEYVRQEEVALLLRKIAEDACGGTRAVDVGRCIGSLSSRVVLRLLQSKATVEVGGENLLDLIAATEDQIAPILGDLIPWLSCFDFLRLRHMRRLHDRMDNLLSMIIAERKQSASHHDDLLQSLLSREADANTTSSELETVTSSDIKAILIDMIVGGVQTTSVTIEWAMAELLRKPECFRRLQREINTVLGKKQQITDADVAKLSYLKCVMKEVFRLHPAGPLLGPRISMDECKVQGYVIPKNTLFLVNAWAIQRDDKVWADAEEFAPERFEGKDIDVNGLHFELIPFGSGRRICVGMGFGAAVVEVALANLVNTFDWELPGGQTPSSLSMDEVQGISLKRASPLLAIPKPRVI